MSQLYNFKCAILGLGWGYAAIACTSVSLSLTEELVRGATQVSVHRFA